MDVPSGENTARATTRRDCRSSSTPGAAHWILRRPTRYHADVTDTTDLAHQLGAALGDGYVVERPLGEGGFAVVFLVRDVALKRHLAVKVLSPDMITSKTVLDRFRREAETVAQLSHPNIVPLHFIGQKDDLLYLAMQCVDGGSIADRLERERSLSVEDAIKVASAVASALAHAHKRGVIHRDIKPANVLVDAESGRCLITDFGIARSADASALTATGMMIGTPAYLSPEQVTGDTVDHRADIFALGVMLYEMLAGRTPYDAPTASAAMMKRLGGPPASIRLVRPDVPEDIAAVITTCLAADPADRFQSATDVLRALGGDFVTTAGRSTRTVPVVHKPRRWLAIVAGAALLVVIGWRVIRERSADGEANRDVVPNISVTDSSMVKIPAGAYVIGDDSRTVFARPRHTVQLPAFAIDRTEVTVDAYRKYVEATRAPWSTTETDGGVPATHVAWNDAGNYCAWRHKAGGRLPTEFEWEAAARGRAGRSFPWGEGLEGARANTASFGRKGPVSVGSFPAGATPDGVQDMVGNVWEWTSSSFAAYPGAPALPDSMRNYRVSRGGGFDTIDSLATTTLRGRLRFDTPAATLVNTGFRCMVPAMAEAGRRP
ncbi:MAG: bifunctional serine/threonine-protein kinase/formylglycine-generating enzyme family protein [bacterium]